MTQMDVNVDSRTRIDKYLSEHNDAKTGEMFPISLKGEKKLLTVYKLPSEMLFYNIKNGRFAAEYKELLKTEGGHLNPEDKSDEEAIKKLLLKLNPGDTKRTYNDLKVREQWNCGIITVDGYLIDGNRRKAIISELHRETGRETFRYLKVARLEGPISSEDLWALEGGIQLGKDEIVRYGPINELLKIREGIDAGLSHSAIVNALYGYEKEEEISEKLELLELMEQYLRFFKVPEKYSFVKNKAEHFIDLQSIISECNSRDYDPARLQKIKHVAFQLIKENIQHLEIRKIRQMIKMDLTSAIDEIEIAGSELKPSEAPSYFESEDKTDKNDVDEFDQHDEETSSTMVRFINATDILDVSKNENKVILILGRAEKNLASLLDYEGDELSTPEAKLLIKKLALHMEGFRKKFME